MVSGMARPPLRTAPRKRFTRFLASVGRRPGLIVAGGFAALIGIGTGLLMLPVATESGTVSDPVTAVFTATSSVCITGLIVVDTPTYWSTFGEMVILGLVQIGGLGIMSLAAVLGMLIFRRFGLRMRLSAQAERKTAGLGDVQQVILAVIRISLLWELATAILLTGRLLFGYGVPLPRAIYSGVFHAVAAFNNAGFALYPDNLMRFVEDPWFCLPVIVASVAGGLGFPVLIELRRRYRNTRLWSLHTKITVGVSAGLLILGTGFVLIAEWTNPATLGPLRVPGKLLAGLFHGMAPRSSGFNTLDVGEMRPETLLLNDVLMLIGGGSASTAGGIKVTTFALLAFVILAELRGEPTVHVMGRRLPNDVQRQALVVALLAIGVVITATVVLMAISALPLEMVLFEVISGFATVGLSASGTGELPAPGQLLIVALMFIGRLGPTVLASALALRDRTRRYELPEERPMVG